MQEIHRGAEAVIYREDNNIIKKRIPKSYRIKEIDQQLRKTRNKREVKVLETLQGKIPVPKVINSDDFEITMEFIEGNKFADVFDPKQMKRVGEIISTLHNSNIAHGDLTTSNMILGNDIYLIDFGLSFFSEKDEDKAVDLHLLKEALEARHFEHFEEAFTNFKQGYKNTRNFKEIMQRLEKVESRGRYKNKGEKFANN